MNEEQQDKQVVPANFLMMPANPTPEMMAAAKKRMAEYTRLIRDMAQAEGMSMMDLSADAAEERTDGMLRHVYEAMVLISMQMGRVLHFAIHNADDSMTVSVPEIRTTIDAQAHVAAWRLLTRSFANEFAAKVQRKPNAILRQLIDELEAEIKTPIGQGQQAEGSSIILPEGMKLN